MFCGSQETLTREEEEEDDEAKKEFEKGNAGWLEEKPDSVGAEVRSEQS